MASEVSRAAPHMTRAALLMLVALAAGCRPAPPGGTRLPAGIILNLGGQPTLVPPPIARRFVYGDTIESLNWDSLTVGSGGRLYRIILVPEPGDTSLFRMAEKWPQPPSGAER